MNVIAGKGYNFKIQGKRVTPEKPVQVMFNHDVKIKLKQGSLIDAKNLKKSQPIMDKPVKEDKKETENKSIKKEK